MAQTCPDCSAEIPPAQMNIAEGVAQCPGCGTLHRLGDLVNEDRRAVRSVKIDEPPKGAWFRDDGMTTRIGARVRSVSSVVAAVFLVGFASFWNAITWTFVAAAVTGVLAGAGINPPWLPAQPAQQGAGGMLSSAAGFGLWLSLGMLAFLLPFMAVALGTAFAPFYLLFGRVELRISGGSGLAIDGVGPLSWTRRFDASRVTSVGTKIEQRRDSSGDIHIEKKIVIETPDKTLKVGSALNDDRRRFVEAALHRLLVAPG